MSSSTNMKRRLLNENALQMIAARFRVLGEPMRLKLLRELYSGECNVTDLVEATGATQANVSRHLAVLLHAGMVYRRKEGLNVYYGIQDPAVFNLCEIVCGGLEKQLDLHTKAIRGR